MFKNIYNYINWNSTSTSPFLIQPTFSQGTSQTIYKYENNNLPPPLTTEIKIAQKNAFIYGNTQSILNNYSKNNISFGPLENCQKITNGTLQQKTPPINNNNNIPENLYTGFHENYVTLFSNIL